MSIVVVQLLVLLGTDSPSGLEQVAKTYRIEIVTTQPKFPVKITHGNIEGKPAEENELKPYIPLFVAEFSLYPPDLVKRTRLKRVVFCTQLAFAGQRRNAVPDWENNTLYLDVARGTYSKPYLRKVIHHEFFHIIDCRDDGNLYQDERWAALNPAGFKYGAGGRAAQDNADTSVLTTKYPGFLNHYSTTGVEEDKAELFANLIVDPQPVADRATSDPVLKAKIERLKDLLAAFSPEVDEKFWERVRVKKRP
jgi:hypothetical protein